MLRPAARAIVIRDRQMLVMRRVKRDRKYMTTPGGRVEDGETNEEAVLREVAEETTLVIANPRLVFIEDPNDDTWGLQYIYLCDYVSGEPALPDTSEEYAFQQQGGGTYEPMWLSFDEALHNDEYPFKSPRMGDEIYEALQYGFPDEPKQWTLPRPVVE